MEGSEVGQDDVDEVMHDIGIGIVHGNDEGREEIEQGEF